MVNNTGDSVDWLHDTVGVEFEEAINHFPEHTNDRAFYPKGKQPGYLTGTMEQHYLSNGGELLLETRAQHLLTEDGRVIGASCSTADGTLNIYADVTLLATGGYEGDMDMYRQFNGGDRIYNAGSPYVTGDGVKMEMALGAQLWHMDGQTMSCGYFHGIKVPDFETTFVVFAHCEGSATATTTEVIRAVGCHFHHVCGSRVDHETDFIEKSPVTNQITRVVDSDDFVVPCFVELDPAASDVFPDEFNHGKRVKIIRSLEVIGTFPAHGS